MEQFRFLKWPVYRDSQILFSEVLTLVKKLPQEHRFSIGDQIIRSALSVILNIAEGSGKHSARELNRYFDIALGSLYETAACIDTIAKSKLLPTDERERLLAHIESIC